MFEDILRSVRPEIWLAFGVLIIAYLLQKLLSSKQMNLPPGPTGLPVVGYLPFLTKNSHLKFMELAEKYGEVFSLNLGSQLVVVLNDVDSIREAFAKREFLGRPPNNPFLIDIDTPFFTPNLHMWQEQRRFVVQTMKDLGLGKTKIEGHIQEEVQYFLTVLGESKGKPLDLAKPLTPSMSNNICALVFGERYAYNNPDRIIMDNALNSLGKFAAQTSVHLFFPWIKTTPILLKIFHIEKAMEAARSITNLIERKVAQHKETLEPKNVRDYIDGYLVEMKERTEKKDSETTFSERTLEGTVLNLFGAGSETVRTSILWSMYTMAAFPDIQKKVQKEITDVLGSNRFPQVTDQKDMPYTQAVIREIIRWKTVAPLGVLRYTIDDTDVYGYDVPRETVVIANLWSAHHSPKHWKDPEEFRPERFLTPDGTPLKSNNFMPFSIGKRACPGEAMALMEIFLYFVAILQKFRVSFPDGYKPTFEAELGITYRLKHTEFCFESK